MSRGLENIGRAGTTPATQERSVGALQKGQSKTQTENEEGHWADCGWRCLQQ